MAGNDKKDPRGKRGLDRRSLLIGAAGGAAVAGAAGAGYVTLDHAVRKLRTPAAVGGGGPAQVAESFADSRPSYTERPDPKPGKPNIVVIVLDDVGFADLGCYGSEIATPNIDRLAGRGLRYSNFRTCAMCSPTRAALMTGLNHHSAGMGWLADLDSGYPGYRGDMTLEAATMAEVLLDEGWSTLHVGKWHVNVAHSNGAAGPYHNWPTSRGFERAYWFQGHSTDYYRPAELFEGRAPLEVPQGEYYALDDLTNRAVTYLHTQRALEPERPFFLQIAYPAAHSPLQVPAESRDAYKGKYDAGWDVVRAARLERQRKMGIVPETTELPPLAPGVSAWDALDSDEKRLFARYMEVYAGLITRLDAAIGRLMDEIEAMGEADNTLVVLFSDNGGSAEGTQTGTPNVLAAALGRPVPVHDALKLYDVMGGDETFPHYPIGWACTSNTPYRLYKQYTHLGGVADPLVVAWPKGIPARGEIRDRFVHVIDLYPTLLDALGLQRPATYRGRKLKPLEGASAAATFADPKAPTRTEQYFELGGQRAYMDGDWRLVTRHARGSSYDDDKWELYDLSKDPNELVDLAGQHPDRVKELVAKWNAAAERYNVFPLDDRNLVVKLGQDRQRRGARANWKLKPPMDRLSAHVSPQVLGFSHEFVAEIVRKPGAGDGVLFAAGSRHAGYVLFIHQGRLIYEQNMAPWGERIESTEQLPEGKITVRYVQTMTSRPFEGGGALFLGDRKLAEKTFQRCVLTMSYDGFSLGADLGNRVSTLYQGPNPFQGELIGLEIKIDAEPFGPLESQRLIDAIAIKI
ncbi:sulfatase-like hydrolase/transferase [Zavarzinia sp.]|uniref:sulfatase-like hydrolase/transferase n=1 Tax=Zavarzinia sp. TaxID=2027920 RepID=UPI00356B09E8